MAELPRDVYYHFEDKHGVTELTLMKLVRCENCKHWSGRHLCKVFSKYGTVETLPNDFCSYGEQEDGHETD